jgi:sugar/nucleoside kinase (ribokinase family)
MKIIGIGNALVDLLVRIPNENLLSELKVKKGSMELVGKEVIAEVINKTYNLEKKQVSGGSAANTIYGTACLGGITGFIGTIGHDEFGDVFSENLKSSHIQPYLYVCDGETGVVGSIITPDSERTMTTFLGAAGNISISQLTSDILKQYQFIHIEGYLVFNRDLILGVARLAKENGLMVSLDLASYNVVEANVEFLDDLIKNYVDIVFANEDEAKALTGKLPEDALHEIAKIAKIAVVKVGKNGSMIKSGNEVHTIKAIDAVVIDTTGAGDLYAGGFIYGISKGLSLNKCGKIGALLAGKVIEQIGAKIPEEIWPDILKRVKAIEIE